MTPWAAFNWTQAIRPADSEDHIQKPSKPGIARQERYATMTSQISAPIFPKSENVYLLKNSNGVGDSGSTHDVCGPHFLMEHSHPVSTLSGTQRMQGSSLDDVSIAMLTSRTSSTCADWQLQEQIILAPFNYIKSMPSKGVREKLIDSLNIWFQIPEESLKIIKDIVGLLHTASLMCVPLVLISMGISDLIQVRRR